MQRAEGNFRSCGWAVNEEIDRGSSERQKDHRSLEWSSIWINSQPIGEEDTAFALPLGFVTGREMLRLPNMCTGVPLGGREQKGVYKRKSANQ